MPPVQEAIIFGGISYINHLHTPQLPPSFAQCLQYLQFLHALQAREPVQVAW